MMTAILRGDLGRRVHGLEIQRAEQVPVDQLHGLARLANGHQAAGVEAAGGLKPGGPVLAPLAGPNPLAAVVVQDYVVACEQDLTEVLVQGVLTASRTAVRGNHVKDVSVQDELGHRTRLEQVAHLTGPRWQGRTHWTSFSVAVSTDRGGGSSSRSSTLP